MTHKERINTKKMNARQRCSVCCYLDTDPPWSPGAVKDVLEVMGGSKGEQLNHHVSDPTLTLSDLTLIWADDSGGASD